MLRLCPPFTFRPARCYARTSSTTTCVSFERAPIGRASPRLLDRPRGTGAPRFPFPRPRGQHRSILFLVSKLPVSVAPPFLARAIPAATVLRASRRLSLSCRLGFLFFRKPWISCRWVPFRLGSSPVLDGSNRRPFPEESQPISLSIGSSLPLRLGWVRNRVYLRNRV